MKWRAFVCCALTQISKKFDIGKSVVRQGLCQILTQEQSWH